MKKNTRNNKKLVTVVLVALFVLIILGAYIFHQNVPKQESKPLPKSTGALFVEYPKEKQIFIERFSSLRNKTPIKETGFEVNFDYKDNKFIVSLENPYETSKDNFLKWLSDNGYGTLPRDMFTYLLD